MDRRRPAIRPAPGRYLHRRGPEPWLTVGVLLVWDGLLIYMIVRCLIAPGYGAAMVAMVSVYFGYQL